MVLANTTPSYVRNMPNKQSRVRSAVGDSVSSDRLSSGAHESHSIQIKQNLSALPSKFLLRNPYQEVPETMWIRLLHAKGWRFFRGQPVSAVDADEQNIHYYLTVRLPNGFTVTHKLLT